MTQLVLIFFQCGKTFMFRKQVQNWIRYILLKLVLNWAFHVHIPPKILVIYKLKQVTWFTKHPLRFEGMRRTLKQISNYK